MWLTTTRLSTCFNQIWLTLPNTDNFKVIEGKAICLKSTAVQSEEVDIATCATSMRQYISNEGAACCCWFTHPTKNIPSLVHYGTQAVELVRDLLACLSRSEADAFTVIFGDSAAAEVANGPAGLVANTSMSMSQTLDASLSGPLLIVGVHNYQVCPHLLGAVLCFPTHSLLEHAGTMHCLEHGYRPLALEHAAAMQSPEHGSHRFFASSEDFWSFVDGAVPGIAGHKRAGDDVQLERAACDFDQCRLG